MTVAQKFEDIGRRIWMDMNLSNQYKTLYEEETITDSILLDIAKQDCFNIRILQTPKLLESVQGTDWEWYVGSNTYGWIRYAIQAKKLNLKSSNYDSLNHKVGQPPKQYRQIDLLQTFARANGAVPLYSFYNYFPKATAAVHWQCPKPFDRELLGWTFTTLTDVINAMQKRGARTFDSIHQLHNAIPIRCLFTCMYFRDLYYDQGTKRSPGTFMGESFRKVESLPPQLINARDISTLGDFPEELYNPQIRIYPKRIAIIDLANNI
jgi:hypothetical protein